MQEELFHARKLEYSIWHRARSIGRFLGSEQAAGLSAIDLDHVVFLEFDGRTREPLALVEVAEDHGQRHKAVTVLARLAARSGLPAYAVLYKVSPTSNPANPLHHDISRFRIRRVHPKPERNWRELTPGEWAAGLVAIRAWSAKRLDLEAANDPYWTPEEGISG
jgi:hypothetical protein